MAGYQYTIIVGNVGRDPELRYTQSGVAVASFSVAVTERWSDRQSNERREKTTWFRVSAWRQLAETVNQYVHKGMQIMIAGTIEASAYLDNAGQAAATLELTARDIQFLGSRGDSQAGGQGSGYDDYGQPPADDLNDIPF
jgi:single-strand DNA-binding protein